MKKIPRYLFRCPDKLYAALQDQGSADSPFLEDHSPKLSPYLARLIEFKFPWDSRDKFHLVANPFKGERTTQIAVRLDPELHKEFHLFAVQHGTNMTRVLIQWLIEEPEIYERLRKRKWI